LRTAIDATINGQRMVIFLRCVKGWTGPPAVGGRQRLGTPDLHKTPLLAPRHDPGQRQQLQDWLASYKPDELFDADGRMVGRLASAVLRLQVRNLKRPPVSLEVCKSTGTQPFDSFAHAVTTVLRVHAALRGLRVFSPDELASNRLAGIVGEPWVVEALAEEVLLGWLAGWTASGRPGLLVSYEAFAPLLTTGIVAHLKQRRLTPTDSTWPSVNLLLTSYGWHNVYTHGDPSLATALLATADPAVHVFTPADPTRVAAVLDEALRSQGRVNLIVAGKHQICPQPVETIGREKARGLVVWPHASDQGEPDLTIVCAGDLPASIACEAAGAVRDRHRRRVRVRVVNIHDLTVLGDPRIWPAGLGDDELDRYLGVHAALLVLTLGHPAAVWGPAGGPDPPPGPGDRLAGTTNSDAAASTGRVLRTRPRGRGQRSCSAVGTSGGVGVIDNVRVEWIDVVTVAGVESCDRAFVAVHAAGHTGWYGPMAEAYGPAAEQFGEAVIGEPVTGHRRVGQMLRSACDPGDKAHSWAAGAIDCAIWDLHGRLAGVPVAALLAASPASAVLAYASWLRLDVFDRGNMGAVAATAAHPWQFTKWGLRVDDPDAASVRATGLAAAASRSARRAGGQVALDALGTWTPQLVEAFADQVDPSTLMWLEDPLPRHNLDQYRVLAATGLPFAVGERLLAGDDPAKLIDVVRPAAFTLDVVGCGGLTRAIDLVALAGSAGVPVYPHGRSLVPAVHLAAAFPDTVVAVEYQLQWEPVRRSLYAESWLPHLGQLRVPATPGLGVTPRSR